MKKRKFILATLFAIITSCAEKKYVSFTVLNKSATILSIQYVIITNNDTINAQIDPNGYPNSSYLISNEELTGASTNWYYDYDISIKSITNLAGDSVNFNPDIASNWYLEVAGTHYNYFLKIYDSSF